MCGIALGLNKALNDSAVRSYLALRGPDNFSHYTAHGSDAIIDLYQSRLSIVDRLERSNQPMTFKDEEYVLIFNGEMYNHKEIRQSLELAGNVFMTDSDTEVFGEALIQLGVVDTLENVIAGPYAFVLLDLKKDEIYFGVDKHGEKPLYFCNDGDFLSVVSDQRIIVDSNSKLKIDVEALDVFSSLGYFPRDYEFFEGVKRCRPGVLYKYSVKRKSLIEINLSYSKRKVLSFSEALNRSLTTIMDTDFTPAVLLSAGVDSRLLALKIKALDIKANFWTLGFEGYKCEADIVEKWCETNSIKVNRVNITKTEFLDAMKEVQFNFDVPFGDTSAALMHHLAKKISNETRVVITGDGADEIFAAYPRYRRQFIGLFLSKINLRPLGWGRADSNWISKMLKGFWRPSTVDLQNYLPYNGLVKSDRVFMTNNIENRAPYLFPEVVKHRTSLSGSIFRRYKSKQIRELNGLGSALLTSKLGFSVPYKDELSSLFDDTQSSTHSNIQSFRRLIFKFWCESNGYEFKD